MKKELIFTFQSGDERIKDCTIYSYYVPENEDIITLEELQSYGIKKAIKLQLNSRYIPDKIGSNYEVRITAEILKELFDFK